MAKAQPPFDVFMAPEYFFRILNFLTDNYQIVSTAEAIHLLETNQSLADDVFTLTFDDCYKGWINHVLPECQRLGVPITVFVTTGPLDSGKPLLYDALVFLAENTWRKFADLSSWHLGVFLLDNFHNILSFVKEVVEYWQGRSREDRVRFLEELSGYFGVSLNSDKFKNRILNWDDIREMDKQGVTIGAHTVSHICLRDLENTECFLEVSESKKRLEEELGHSVNFFAYPYGARDHYKSDTMKVVAEAGFYYAFTLGVNDGNRFRPLEIGRRGVSGGMFARPNGNFHEALFATEVCGLGDFLFGRIFG
jgi:peptidoglycan/xylan/chitin deacetylase (PgdA/CDA1 family)